MKDGLKIYDDFLSLCPTAAAAAVVVVVVVVLSLKNVNARYIPLPCSVPCFPGIYTFKSVAGSRKPHEIMRLRLTTSLSP